MKEKLFILLIGVVIGVILIVIIPKDQKLGFTGAGINVFSEGVTNTSVSCVGATATQLMALSNTRQYAMICLAPDSADIVYLQFGVTKAGTAATGIPLASSTGDCYEIDATNLYTGNIDCAPITSTTTLRVLYK